MGVRTVLLAIVGLVVGLILSATILPDVVTESATDAYSEPFSVGSGVTNTTERLSYASYYEDLTGLSVASDMSEDAPLILSYDEDTWDVLVVGLDASVARILTISYLREAHQQFLGFAPFLRFLPFLCIAGLVVVFMWSLFAGIRSRG